MTPSILHRSEVSDVVRRYYPDITPAKEYLDLVEKKRGKDAADALRRDVWKEWKQRRADQSEK